MKKPPYEPSIDELDTAPRHIVHDIMRLKQALSESRHAMAWTAWYIHCRSVMEFFESAPLDPSKDDIIATHYVDKVEWSQTLAMHERPTAYTEYRGLWTPKQVGMTYLGSSAAEAADGEEYSPSPEVTEYLLRLARAFYELLPEERKPAFGGLADL